MRCGRAARFVEISFNKVAAVQEAHVGLQAPRGRRHANEVDDFPDHEAGALLGASRCGDSRLELAKPGWPHTQRCKTIPAPRSASART